MRAYLGTYTKGDSQGIYVADFDDASGKLTLTGDVAEVKNPTFLALHPNGRFLYAVTEVSDHEGQPGGAVMAFGIEPSGGLTPLNHQMAGGKGPCHLDVDPVGRCVVVANYTGGSVAILPILEDGRLGPAGEVVQHEGSSVEPRRQAGPHAHSINIDPSGKFAIAADLGIDKLLIYRLDTANAKLPPHDPAFVPTHGGAGPRHLAFDPTGSYAYVINELDSTLIAYRYTASTGTLEPLQTLSTLPGGYEGVNYCADVHVHPNGQFVYGSNREHDTIVIYRVEPGSGELTVVGYESTRGAWPRNFCIDPSGRWLLAANERSDTIVSFAIDPNTGELEATGDVLDVPACVCVKLAT